MEITFHSSDASRVWSLEDAKELRRRMYDLAIISLESGRPAKASARTTDGLCLSIEISMQVSMPTATKETGGTT